MQNYILLLSERALFYYFCDLLDASEIIIMKRIFIVFLIAVISLPAYSQLNIEQYFYIGRSRIYFGNYVSAIENLNIVIKLRPNMPEPYFYRGMAKHYIDDFRGAKIDYDKALYIKPFYPEAYMYRGMANYELKNYKEALSDYSKALEYKSDDQAIYNNRGITKAAMEDLDGAIADYTKAVELDPLSTNSYLNRSSAKQMKGDLEGAIKDCDAAIRIRPHFASAYLMRGIAKFEKEDYAGALKDYDICIRLDGKMSQAFVNRGIVKHKLEDARGAIIDYDMAIQLNPDIAVAWLNRGIAKESLKIPGAEQDFAVAEQLDPKFAQFRKRYKEEQEKERQLRVYGMVLPSGTQAQNKQQNATANQANQAQANQPASAGNQSNQSQPQQTAQAGNQGSQSQSQPTAQAGNPPDAKADTASQKASAKQGPVTPKRSRRNIVVDESGQVNETEITNGMVQNRNVKIELQPEFTISMFHKDSVDYRRLQYYSMEIDALNHKNNNDPFLLITNKTGTNEAARKEGYQNSIRELDKTIRDNKKNSTAYFDRGIFYELSKDYNKAIEDYDRAINLDGRNIMAYFSRANSRLKMVDYILMPGILPEPATLILTGTKAKSDTIKRQEKILDYDEVIKDYESILYMNPKFIFAWFNMGNTKVKKRDYVGAIDDYSKAIELEPDYAEAYYNRGLTRIFLDDLDGGSVDLSKAGELGLVEAYNVIKRYCN
jgi:tetratricopeptide (TPR) repeat protein